LAFCFIASASRKPAASRLDMAPSATATMLKCLPERPRSRMASATFATS